MSDTPQGDGWWQASDGQYYPPESHPDHQAATYPPSSQEQPAPAWGAPTPPVPSAANPLGNPFAGWEWNLGTILLVIGIGGTVFGAFLPWVSLGIFSASGLDGDGVITLPLGILAGALGVIGVGRGSKGMTIGALIAFLLISLVGIYNCINILTESNQLGLNPSIGGGLLLTTVMGMCGVVAAALLLNPSGAETPQAA